MLIHGAWYGGWCWRNIIKRLHGVGYHRVFAPCLTGLGSRSHLLDHTIGLSTHINDIVNLIETEELEDVSLVGHSYGGMVITGVADRLSKNVTSLLYLDAYTPENGQSAFDIRTPQTLEDKVVQLDIQHGNLAIPPPSPRHHGLDGPILDWACRHMKPHPMRCFQERIQLDGNWLTVPNKVYFRATKFPSFYFDNYLVKWSKDPNWITKNEDVHHNYMMMNPDWFLQLLLETFCLKQG